MPTIPKTPRTTHRRLPARGSHDQDLVHAILDEGLVAHVAFALEGQPYAIPMSYARDGDRLVLHGAPGSRLLQAARAGAPLCVTVTLLDALVVSRSAFHHSMNYRSAMVLGVAAELQGREEKRAALAALVEHVIRGRTAETRPPTDAELDGTRVLVLPIAEASAKVRTGPPVEVPGDEALPWWGGVLPLSVVPGPPQPDALVPAGRAAPDGVARYRRGR